MVEPASNRAVKRSGLDLFALNAALAFVWVFITGIFTAVNMIVGFALAFVALYVPRHIWGDTHYFRRTGGILRLFWVFLYELAVSGFTVAWLVFQPRMRFKSAIVDIPLDTESELEVTVFANLISLTPGTLSLDVSDDQRALYVHVMDCGDAESERHDMKQTFERNIREALS